MSLGSVLGIYVSQFSYMIVCCMFCVEYVIVCANSMGFGKNLNTQTYFKFKLK